METALIRTTIWEDEKIDELNSDTRLLYLALLTNPKRNTTKVFRCPDKLLVAYTGYDIKLINLCRSQLIEKNFIKFIDNYYILNGDEFVEAKKGRFTKSVEKTYLSKLPGKILNLLKNKDISSRGALEYNNKYNNKDKDKDINNNKDKKQAVNFDLFYEKYPKKRNKLAARKSFIKLNPNVLLLKEILESIKKFKETKEWKKDGGQFIPYPATWLNNKRWEDEITTKPKTTKYDHLTKVIKK